MHIIKKMPKYFFFCLVIAAFCFVQIACSGEKKDSSNSTQSIPESGQAKPEDQSKAKVVEVPADEPKQQPAQSKSAPKQTASASKPAEPKQQAQQTQQAQPPQQDQRRPVREEPPPPPPPRTYTMNVGTRLSVITTDDLSTKKNQNGDKFVATLAQTIEEDGWVIAERGAEVEGVILNSDPGGRVSGVASMTVALKKLTLADGRTISISTDSYTQQAKSTKTKDAVKIGAGAGIGAAIGAIAGGGKGAAIGAAVGGGAGTAHTVATRGDPAVINGEQRLSFTLKSPITITER